MVTIPRRPSPIPALVVEPESLRGCANSLLAASAQIDDIGTFVAGGARIDDWISSEGSSAYHQGISPIGRRADAMSLALRGVAQRADHHADEMADLLVERGDLDDRRRQLAQQVALLQTRALGTLAPQALVDLEDDCARIAGYVTAFEADLQTWRTSVSTEEQAMSEAFARVLESHAIERIYGGQTDPADAALDAAPPTGAAAEEVNAWWDALTSEEQQAIIAAAPGAIGNLDGIPAGARDEANRVALARDLAEWETLETGGMLTDDERTWLENARAADDARREIEDRVDPITGLPIEAQLYLYDPAAFDGDGAIGISCGDLDTADNVAVLTPGFGTDGESAPYQAARAATMYESTRFLDPDESNATLFWIGYDAPDNAPWHEGGDNGWDGVGVISEQLATSGGERLADAIAGLRAGRDGDPAHLTAIGHSYGSTTSGHAAHDQELRVDDLVFVGSPGVGGDTNDAGDTGIDPDHVWAGANSRDPITYLANHGWFHLETFGGAGLGDDPAEDDFGARRFQAESTSRGSLPEFGQHSLYFDHGTESLYNISQIVNGDYVNVLSADHTYDPWYAGVQDPELDREPTPQVTR